MPKKYIKAGVPAGDLYDVVNALTGAQEDGSQGDATLGPNGEIAIDKDGNITMNPPDGSVHATVDNAIKLNNQPASYYAKATDAFATYTHSFSGGIHNLTGTGDNIKFISVADYNGEPIRVNGTTCTARTIGGDNIWAGFFKRDNMVTCFKKGTILNFNGGGLASSEIAKLTPANIKTGVSIKANGKTITGTFTADGTVAANQMLSGKIAYSKGQKIVGTIPSKASQSYRPTTSNQTINAGYYLSGAQTIQGDANLKSENIKSGVTIFGVRGNLDSNKAVASVGYGRVFCEKVWDKDNYAEIAASSGWADSNYGQLGYTGLHGYNFDSRNYIQWQCTRSGTYTIQPYGQGTMNISGTQYLNRGTWVTMTMSDVGDIYWRDSKSGGFVVSYNQ